MRQLEEAARLPHPRLVGHLRLQQQRAAEEVSSIVGFMVPLSDLGWRDDRASMPIFVICPIRREDDGICIVLTRAVFPLYPIKGVARIWFRGGPHPFRGGARPPIFRLRPQITRVPPYVLLATSGFRGGPGPPPPPPPLATPLYPITSPVDRIR